MKLWKAISSTGYQSTSIMLGLGETRTLEKKQWVPLFPLVLFINQWQEGIWFPYVSHPALHILLWRVQVTCLKMKYMWSCPRKTEIKTVPSTTQEGMQLSLSSQAVSLHHVSSFTLGLELGVLSDKILYRLCTCKKWQRFSFFLFYDCSPIWAASSPLNKRFHPKVVHELKKNHKLVTQVIK